MAPKSKRRLQAIAASAASVKKRREMLISSSTTLSAPITLSTLTSALSTDPTVSTILSTIGTASDVRTSSTSTVVLPIVSSSVVPPASGQEESENEEEDDMRSQEEILDDFCADWIAALDKDDKRSLGIFLQHIFMKHHGMKSTSAAKLVGTVIEKNEKTIRKWRTEVICNKGELPETKQGKYIRRGVLWCNEELNKMATNH